MGKQDYITIGKLAERSGFSADTIRYYEKMGVLEQPERALNGYRVYPPQTMALLLFIKRAKVINFTLEDIKMLISMSENSDGICGDVLTMIEEKISAFKAKLADTQLALDTLQRFAKSCPGGEVPTKECPFLDHLYSKEESS